MNENFILKVIVVVLENTNRSMNMSSDGKSTHRAFTMDKLLQLCQHGELRRCKGFFAVTFLHH